MKKIDSDLKMKKSPNLQPCINMFTAEVFTNLYGHFKIIQKALVVIEVVLDLCETSYKLENKNDFRKFPKILYNVQTTYGVIISGCISSVFICPLKF